MEPEIQRLLRQHKAALREQEAVLAEEHRRARSTQGRCCMALNRLTGITLHPQRVRLRNQHQQSTGLLDCEPNSLNFNTMKTVCDLTGAADIASSVPTPEHETRSGRLR